MMRGALLLLLLPSVASAEIIAPKSAPEHTIFEVKYVAPEGRLCRVLWEVSDGLNYKPLPDKLTLHATGKPGGPDSRWFEATVVSWEPGKVDELDLVRERVRVAIIATPAPATPVVTPPVDPVEPTTPATAATYVYEKDESAIPTAVLVGLNRLNRERKIVATLFERDTKDGDGDTPDQYRVPLAAGRQAGLPALVVTAGEQVLRVVKAPTTEAQVMEAAP